MRSEKVVKPALIVSSESMSDEQQVQKKKIYIKKELELIENLAVLIEINNEKHPLLNWMVSLIVLLSIKELVLIKTNLKKAMKLNI